MPLQEPPDAPSIIQALPFTLVLVLLGTLANLPFFWQWGGMEDEAITVLGGRLVLEGALPYRDFGTAHTPGSYFVTAAVLWLLQDPQLTARGLACLSGGLLGAGLYILLRVGLQTPQRWALWAWFLLTCTGVTQWPILNYHWFSTIASLFGGACVVVWARQGSRRACWLAGALCAISAWMVQSDGASVAFAAFGVAVLFPERRKEFLQFLAALACASAALWIPLALKVGPAAIWENNVASLIRYGPFGRSPFTLAWVLVPTRQVVSQMLQAHWSAQMVVWAVHSLSYLLVWWFKYGLFWLWIVLWLCGKPWKRTGSRALIAVLAGSLALSFYRQDMLYLNYYTPMLYAVLADGLAQPGPRWRSLGAMGVAVLFGLQYGGLLLDVAEARYPIVTPGGTYSTANPLVAQEMADIGKWWRDHHPDQGTVFVYPFRPSLYTLFRLKPATRFFMIFPMNYTEENLQAAQRDLAHNRPLWILRSPLSDEIFKDLPNVDPVAFKARSREWDEKLLRGYRLYQDGTTQIYRREDGG